MSQNTSMELTVPSARENASPLQFNESFLSMSQSNLSIASLSQQPPFSVADYPVRRYFDYDESTWCKECGQVGHSTSTCKSRKRATGACFCCGEDQHQVDACKANICILCGESGCVCRKRNRLPGSLLDLLDIDAFVSTYANECYRCNGTHSGLICPEYMPHCRGIDRCKFCFERHASCDCPELRKVSKEKRASLMGKMRCFICGAHDHYQFECKERNFSLRVGYRFRGNEYSKILHAYNARNVRTRINQQKTAPSNDNITRGAYTAIRGFRFKNSNGKQMEIQFSQEFEASTPRQCDDASRDRSKFKQQNKSRGDFRMTKDRFVPYSARS